MEDLNKKFFRESLWRVAGIAILAIIGLLYYYQHIYDFVLFGAAILGIFLLLKTAIEKLMNSNKIGYEFFITVGVVLLLFEKQYNAAIIILIIILIRSLKDLSLTRTIALIEDEYEYKSSIEYWADKILRWLAPVILFITGLIYILTDNLHLVLTLLIFISFPDLGIIISSVKMFARTRAIKERILIPDVETFDEISEIDTIIFTQDVLYMDGKQRPELKEVFSSIRQKGKYGIHVLIDDQQNVEERDELLKEITSSTIPMNETIFMNNKLMIIGNESDYETIFPYSHLKFLVGFSGIPHSEGNTNIISLDNNLKNLATVLSISAMSEKVIKENIFLIIPLYCILAVIAVLYFDLTIIQTAILFLVPEALVFLNSIKLLGKKINH
ncbi:hypothetical protein OZ666_11110 [Elizabethkingia sp. HX QKY]|uniref:hypothetical protein n=1 Tax=Elizabethkingia TaxID=308865 RepID=UPI002A24103D|nr:hypothetical protein [Elizabethkingia sp. HX QKY]MDX8572232.1 hypothetical protein [Elizabethkingia sp. HX QKY]